MICLPDAKPADRPRVPRRFGASKYELAGRLYASTILGGGYANFLTSLCYDHIVTAGRAGPRL